MAVGIVDSSRKEAFANDILGDRVEIEKGSFETREYYTNKRAVFRKSKRRDLTLHHSFLVPDPSQTDIQKFD